MRLILILACSCVFGVLLGHLAFPATSVPAPASAVSATSAELTVADPVCAGNVKIYKCGGCECIFVQDFGVSDGGWWGLGCDPCSASGAASLWCDGEMSAFSMAPTQLLCGRGWSGVVNCPSGNESGCNYFAAWRLTCGECL